MKELDKKVIIVTGGSGLIGTAILKECVLHGALVINLDIRPSEVEEVQNIRANTTCPGEIETTINYVVEQYGKIDGFVNNAYPRTKDWGTPFEEDKHLDVWRKNLDLQLNSYIQCCQTLVTSIKEQSSLSVVNMSSIYGTVANDMNMYKGTRISPVAPYSAIKGGLNNATRFLASLYGSKNYRFNTVSPGGIFDHQDPSFVNYYNDKVPMNRMGNPDDIAPAVRFLLSDGARYITGQNIIIDGGWTAI